MRQNGKHSRFWAISAALVALMLVLSPILSAAAEELDIAKDELPRLEDSQTGSKDEVVIKPDAVIKPEQPHEAAPVEQQISEPQKPVAEEQPTDEDDVEEKPVLVDVIEEETVIEDVAEEEPVKEESVEDEPVEEEPIEAEPVEGELVETEPVGEEPNEGEPLDGEPIEGELVEEEPVEDGAAYVLSENDFVINVQQPIMNIVQAGEEYSVDGELVVVLSVTNGAPCAANVCLSAELDGATQAAYARLGLRLSQGSHELSIEAGENASMEFVFVRDEMAVLSMEELEEIMNGGALWFPVGISVSV